MFRRKFIGKFLLPAVVFSCFSLADNSSSEYTEQEMRVLLRESDAIVSYVLKRGTVDELWKGSFPVSIKRGERGLSFFVVNNHKYLIYKRGNSVLEILPEKAIKEKEPVVLLVFKEDDVGNLTDVIVGDLFLASGNL